MKMFLQKNLKIVVIGVAVIVLILFLLFGRGTINKSSVNKDKVIVDEINQKILDYLKIYSESFSIYEGGVSFLECPDNKSKCDDKDKVKVYVNTLGIHKEGDKNAYEIRLSNLVTVGMLNDEEIVGVNGNRCFSDIFKGVDPIVYTFQNNSKEFYYYVDLSGNNTKCNFSKEFGIINNLPKELVKVLVEEKYDIPEELANSVKMK